MKTGYYDLKKASAGTGRFGMHCIGVLMVALVFTIAGLEEYPVCHAQSNFHQFTE